MTRWSGLRQALRDRLTQPLPGWEAQKRAWPDHLPQPPKVVRTEPFVPAAVLIALHPVATDRDLPPLRGLRFPLIQRPEAQRTHPGQVALPGGLVEPGESILEAALREAREEIGLDPALVEPLGRLTPFNVDVSGFRIHPVVGWVEHPPQEWILQKEEVAAVYSADPDRLLQEGPGETLRRLRGGLELEVPAYQVFHGEMEEKVAHVWGATAIILAEFLEVWSEIS